MEEKNLAYRRHWIFWPMRIVSPLPWRRKYLMGGSIFFFFLQSSFFRGFNIFFTKKILNPEKRKKLTRKIRITIFGSPPPKKIWTPFNNKKLEEKKMLEPNTKKNVGQPKKKHFTPKKKKKLSSHDVFFPLWQLWYYPHRSRELVSSVCGTFVRIKVAIIQVIKIYPGNITTYKI